MKTISLAAFFCASIMALVGCSRTAPPPGGAAGVNTTPRQNAETVETPGRSDGTDEIMEGQNPGGG